MYDHDENYLLSHRTLDDLRLRCTTYVELIFTRILNLGILYERHQTYETGWIENLQASPLLNTLHDPAPAPAPKDNWRDVVINGGYKKVIGEATMSNLPEFKAGQVDYPDNRTCAPDVLHI